MEQKNKWRRLDNSAKIFPLSAGKKYSTVFRLSVLLKEDIKKDILMQAVKSALEKYDVFKVKMKAGFFWYYLEENDKEPIIGEERDYPCKYINPKQNNDYLFKITYFKNKINIDIYHALTDGNGGNIFFREIIYTYLELAYPNDFSNNRRIKVIESNIEDSYLKNYNKKAKNNMPSKRAYELRGRKIKLGAISVIHQIIDLEKLKIESQKYDATVTQYLTSVLLYSIYKANYIRSTKPVNICIPVNLKKYFPSETLSNFFSYITIIAEKQKLKTFDDMINFVKGEFNKKLEKEEIIKTMSANVKLGNHILIKTIPLFLKNIIVRLSYLEIRKHSTITFSNIGRIGILGDYQKYIDYFLVLVSPDSVEKVKCSSCTFGNKIAFTFTSILNDNKIEKTFYEFLTEKGIEVEVESNGVLDDISKKDNK